MTASLSFIGCMFSYVLNKLVNKQRDEAQGSSRNNGPKMLVLHFVVLHILRPGLIKANQIWKIETCIREEWDPYILTILEDYSVSEIGLGLVSVHSFILPAPYS